MFLLAYATFENVLRCFASGELRPNVFEPFVVPPPVARSQFYSELMDGILSVGGLPEKLMGMLIEPAMALTLHDFDDIPRLVFLSLGLLDQDARNFLSFR